MVTPKIINYPHVQVTLRKDFLGQFSDHLHDVEKKTGASYVGHNIIKNYRQKDHQVSTFCNKEAWHDLYWEKYCNDDPSERVCHAGMQKTDFALTSWQVDNEKNSCSEERMKATHTKDGLTFSFRRKEVYYETFIFGWNHLKTDKMDVDYLFHITSLLKPLRDHHWAVHNLV